MADQSQISSDLIWEIARNQNAFLVKRKASGSRKYFSRDPLNLTNQQSRTQAGFVNEKAVGIQAGPNGEGVTMSRKKTKGDTLKKPASSLNSFTWKKDKPNRRIYQVIANQTAKNGYRPDLRPYAVSRASAIKRAQRPKKETPERKPRGAKARKDAGV